MREAGESSSFFEGSVTLTLWAGGTTTVREAVTVTEPPLLVGYSPTGEPVPTRVVTGRVPQRKEARKAWSALTVRARISPAAPTWKPTVLRAAPTTPILTAGGWRPVSELGVGDLVHSAERRFDAAAEHLFASSLLGDGTVVPASSAPFDGSPVGELGWFREAHGPKQKDLSVWLHSRLVNCVGVLSHYPAEDMWAVQSRRYRQLGEMRRLWYPAGTKVVPEDLSWVDDFTVAKWYMDDGCLARTKSGSACAKFATHGFGRDGSQRLAALLTERYRVNARAIPDKGSFYVYVTPGLKSRGNLIANLWEAIAPHVIPSMRYKLPEGYRSVAQVEYPVASSFLAFREERVTGAELVDASTCRVPFSRTGYELHTDTGTFLARNVLVACCEAHRPR